MQNQFTPFRLAGRTDAEAARRRMQAALCAFLTKLPEYPEPRHRGDDVVRERNATAVTLAYLLAGAKAASERPASGLTPAQARAAWKDLVAALDAEGDGAFPPDGLPAFEAASLDQQQAQGAEDVAQIRAHIAKCEVTLAELEARLTESHRKTGTYLTVTRVERRRVAAAGGGLRIDR